MEKWTQKYVLTQQTMVSRDACPTPPGLGLGQTTATVGGTRCMLNTYRYVQTIRGRICITSSPLALAIRRAACVASHTAHAEACLSVVQACLSAVSLVIKA